MKNLKTYMFSKNFENTYATTSNCSVYNKIRKIKLECEGEISCSICPYNKGENRNGKWYGTCFKKVGVRYPSWKLTSKNPKQYFPKEVKKNEIFSVYLERKNMKSFELVFGR